MITAVDTNILFDIFSNSQKYGDESSEKLKNAYNKGAIVICPIVYSELSYAFPNQSSLDEALAQLNIQLVPFSTSSLFKSGQIMKKYLKKGGPKKRVIPDFLIGAHALEHADSLLTRDRGFYRDYFKGLKVS